MPKVLSFALSSSTEIDPDTNAGYLAIEVEALLDGQSPYRDGRADMLDAIVLLVCGVEPSHLDVYTCSCGVAGCVGIHEEVVLTCSAHEVAWEFPEAPFRERLDAGLFPASVPLRVTFGVCQYRDALQRLERDIAALGVAAGIPVAVAPFGGSPDATDDFSAHIVQRRQRRAAYFARVEAQRVAEGDLRNYRLEAVIDERTTLSVSLAELAWASMAHFHGDYDDELEHLGAVVRPTILVNPFAAARAVPLKDVLAWADVASAEDSFDPWKQLTETQWQAASLHLEALDT